jgi:hypothetical protein
VVEIEKATVFGMECFGRKQREQFSASVGKPHLNSNQNGTEITGLDDLDQLTELAACQRLMLFSSLTTKQIVRPDMFWTFGYSPLSAAKISPLGSGQASIRISKFEASIVREESSALTFIEY